MFLLAVGVMCLTACAQKKGGERGPRQGGHMVINKDSDSVFVALKQEALGKFKQLTFNDELTGIETLRQVSRQGFYEELERRSEKFIERLKRVIDGKGIQLNHCGSMFTLFFTDQPVRNFADAKKADQERFARYFQNMLERGIYVSPSQFEGNFISESHTDEILDYVLKSIKESIE